MNKDRELIEIARIGDLRRIEELLSQGADIHANNDDALRWAAWNGHFEVMKYLVERGADIHANNDEALRWAAWRGYVKLVRYLVEQSRYSVEELLTHSSEDIRNYALKEYGYE